MDHRPICKSYNFETLRRNHVINLYDFSLGKDFFDMTSWEQGKKDKLDFTKIKIKTFHALKNTIKKMQR